jgi:uncharacterized phage protein gp47/JayE
MPLQTQSYSQLVQNQVAAAQAQSSSLLDFTAGSVLLSLIEANTSGVALWEQGLILQLLAVTRLATSVGSDVDSFVGDFGLTRLPAVASTGLVTFSRFTNTAQAVVLANATPADSTQVQTADGTQTFYVTIDTSNPDYNSALGGYIITAGTTSIQVPVQANTAGAASNVAAGAISVLTTTIPYVDTVTNETTFSNGLDQETDDALKARFVAYLASLARATKTAIGYAINSVQQGLTYSLTENENYNGDTSYGYFYVVVDDGTGAPSDQLLENVNAAIDAYRACTVMFGVFAPIVVTADIEMTITVAAGYTEDVIAADVVTAIETYINALGVGVSLPYTRLMQIAYDVSPGITQVTGVTINSGTADLDATNQDVIRSGTVTVNT